MVHPSFQACINWKIDLLEFEGYCFYAATFRRIYFKHQIFLRAIYIFQNTTTCSYPFFEVVHNFIQENNCWQRSILSNVLAFFGRHGSSCSHQFLQGCCICCKDLFNTMFISKKVDDSYTFFQRYYYYSYRRRWAIDSFKGTAYFSDVKICSHLLFPAYFKVLGYFATPVTVNQISHRRISIFILTLIILEMGASTSLKQLIFQENNFFRTPSCLEQLRVSKNYFLVAKTFSDQVFLEGKYCFSTATTWKELPLNK